MCYHSRLGRLYQVGPKMGIGLIINFQYLPGTIYFQTGVIAFHMELVFRFLVVIIEFFLIVLV